MDDWRINGDEDFLKNAVLYEIKFPEFWEKSYREKNAFFQLVKNDAENYIKTMLKSADYLNEEKIQYFWHEHCFFCWEKVATDAEKVFYCTENMQAWICCECFKDFKDKFQWVVKSSDEWHPKEVLSFRKIIKY